MKKIFKLIAAPALMLGLLSTSTSCLKEYLDKAPESGLSEEEVFSKYANFKSFLYTVYDGANTKIRAYHPLTWAFNNQKFTMEALTDMYDMTRYQTCQPVKMGDGSKAIWVVGENEADANNKNKEAAKVTYAWRSIRICNMAIEKIDMLQDATEKEKLDLLAQAYFIRAYINFEIFRLYGAVPYVDKVLGPDDDWDLPAPTEYDFCLRCAEDFQTAAEIFKQAGLVRRDPASGNGHLAAPDMNKPNGAAAVALKARALLYAASPLNNVSGDKQAWVNAAEACWEAIRVAKEAGFALMSAADYTKNFYGNSYCNESLWSFDALTNTAYKDSRLQALVPYCFSKDKYASGQCPTQNFVDKFETKDGYALNTEADRAIATAAGSYYEQNPFVNRDPRFENAIIYNQKDLSKGGFTTPASLYVEADGSTPSTGLRYQPNGDASYGVTETFYYECKRTGGPYSNTSQTITLTDPIIRLAELYLNYAEAAFEAYGSPEGKAPAAAMTSIEALNEVRTRIGMPPIREEYQNDPAIYRSRIKNERCVELFDEGYHYYCDIRRWKDAPEIGRSKLYGMRATKLAPGYDATVYPTGFKYDRFPLPDNRQIAWKNDGMYYIRFNTAILQKMKNYTPKMEW